MKKNIIYLKSNEDMSDVEDYIEMANKRLDMVGVKNE